MKNLDALTSNWRGHEFYSSAVVLGLDIGLGGIGLWLRKGPALVWARTYEVEIPESAPLRSRRLKRSARRSRQAEKRRDRKLKAFCARFALPWLESNTNPFKLRLRAITTRLASKEALVLCLRHIIRHRGYDYHLTNDATFPWGDELDARKALAWAKETYCTRQVADGLLYEVAGTFKEADQAKFKAEIDAAVERLAGDPMRSMLEKHFAQKSNVRPAARNHNFPREVVWAHMQEICERHADLLGGPDRLKEALEELQAILNDHRKEPGALAERRVKRCLISKQLFGGKVEKCGINAEPAVRNFKLLEFIATRTFVSKDGARRLANPETIQWLLDEVARDRQAVEAKTERPSQRNLRKEFSAKAGYKLAADKGSHNKDFFDQLRDLLVPRITLLKQRASLSTAAAAALFTLATKDGLVPESIQQNLKLYYQVRRDPETGFGIYPQVEFLLGRRGKAGQQAVPGKLRQLFGRQEVQQALGGQQTPDYVVIEVIGDIPRNDNQKREFQAEQKRRREFKEELFARYELHADANESDRKRVLLFDQQRGLCPYTGASLGKNPLSPDLQIDHIFPRSQGGVSEMVNLVLTQAATNATKGERSPWQCYQSTWSALVERLATMQWNKAKREVFLWQLAECPPWQNLTRTAQLARQLREEAAQWLGIKGRPDEMARRIGTPSGYQTALCRGSWAENLPAKNRGNKRHHLWDAAVVAHIPPGPGMNHVRYGGIFYDLRPDRAGDIAVRALPLGPDMLAFERAHQNECLVEKPRQVKSKRARTKETIYGIDAADHLWARDLVSKDDAPVKNAEKLLEQAGFPAGKLTTGIVQDWATASSFQPLRLSDKTRVERVPMQANNESPTTLVAHRNAEGAIIGYKLLTETYLRCEIWRAPDGTYQRRLIPHPRGLHALRSRNINWNQKPTGKAETLRQNVCGKLAPFSKKVGEFSKGDLLRLPLDAQGDICLPPIEPICHLWYRISSIYSDGRVEMKLAEYADKQATPLAMCLKKIESQQPSSAKLLAALMQLRDRHDQSPDPVD